MTGSSNHNLYFVFNRYGKWPRKIKESRVVPGKAMKTYGGIEICLHSFLILDDDDGSGGGAL